MKEEGGTRVKMKWDWSRGNRAEGVMGGFTKAKEGSMANLMKTIY